MTADLKLAVRHVTQRKVLSTCSVLLLALGAGIAGILATVVLDVMVSPFAYQNDGKLVLLAQQFPSRNSGDGVFTAYDYLALQDAPLPAFAGIGAINWQPGRLRRGDTAERIARATLTRTTFEITGVQPMLGRYFHPDEVVPGAPPVAVLSHKAWTNRFAADPTVVGQTAMIDDVAHTIIGVMPPRYVLWGAEVWTPLTVPTAPSPLAPRQPALIASVRTGYTIAEAQAQLQQHFDALAPLLPAGAEEYHGRRVEVVEILPLVLRGLRQTLLFLSAAVVLLLVLTAINFGSLTFLRLEGLREQLSIRTALGATRAQLAAQLLAEVGVIGFAGGAVAALLVHIGVPAFLALTPATFIPAEAEVRVEPLLLVATAVSAGLLALVSAAVPVVRFLRAERTRDLAGLTRGGRGSKQSRRAEAVIVSAETALTCAIVLCTVSVAVSFDRRARGDGGFTTDPVTTVRLLLPPESRGNEPAAQAAMQAAEQALAGLPGAKASALAEHRPMIEVTQREFGLPNRPDERPWAHFRPVTPGYLEATGMRLQSGRFIAASDSPGSAAVVVINETLARTYFSGTNPLESTLVLPPRGGGSGAARTLTIIGVVRDTRQAETLRAGAQPELFVPLAQSDRIPADLAVLVRSADRKLVSVPVITDALQRALGESASFFAPLDFSALTDQLLAQHRLGAFILSVLGGVALVISAVGLYSLLAFSLSQRTREMGIRQALGATSGALARLFIRRGLGLTGIGLLAGLALYFALHRWAGGRILEATIMDPLSTFVSLTVLISVALVASAIPAIRAARTDPVHALRAE